ARADRRDARDQARIHPHPDSRRFPGAFDDSLLEGHGDKRLKQPFPSSRAQDPDDRDARDREGGVAGRQRQTNEEPPAAGGRPGGVREEDCGIPAFRPAGLQAHGIDESATGTLPSIVLGSGSVIEPSSLSHAVFCSYISSSSPKTSSPARAMAEIPPRHP